ncbi:helix-turn-helix domain-containing protein [Lachnospiraceae bacterium 48-33]
MDILRNKTQGFTIVNNQILKDKNMGQRERGMYATLCSLPDGWELSVAGLNAILPDGKTAITNSLNLLEKHGYLARSQRRVRGRITGTEWEITVPKNVQEAQDFSENISKAGEGAAVLLNKIQGVTIVNNHIIRGELSLKERGILITLLSLPNGWRLSIKGLSCVMADGKHAIGQALRHLEEKGYLIRKQARNSEGKMTQNIWQVYDTPVNKEYVKEEEKAGVKKAETEERQETKKEVLENSRREQKVSATPSGLKRTAEEIRRFFQKRRFRKKKRKGRTKKAVCQQRKKQKKCCSGRKKREPDKPLINDDS